MFAHNDVVRNTQPKSSAFPGYLGCEKRFKNMFFYLFRDSLSVIGHRAVDMFLGCPCFNRYAARRVSVLSLDSMHTVNDQVQQNLIDLRYIAVSKWWFQVS